MRGLSNLLLVFNVQQKTVERQDSSPLGFLERIPLFSSIVPLASDREEERDARIQELLNVARTVGQAGSLASEEQRALLESLADQVIPFSDGKAAKYPLEGEHQLVYSAAPGASSGRVFGSIVGKVSQSFENDEIFYNRVSFGPLQISLQAKREIKNDSTIKVSFLETAVSLFGQTVSKKELKGGGIWKCRFVGKVRDESGGEKLVRIMDTPSLFILEQPLN